ncbi:MAG: phosphoenolpyruvate synthase [Pseudomonadota bacterium]
MRYVRLFDELTIDDVPLVGGKNASLGEMFRTLKPKGVNVPGGFATTAEAYWAVIDHNDLRGRIFDLLATLDVSDVVRLAEVGQTIRDWLTHAELPDELAREISEAYRQMGDNLDVAVRSSATAEDLPTASFAGQQETYLNIRGEASLLATCKRVFASLFTDRAIAYRTHQGFEHDKVALSIGVQRMVRSDLAASGVMFTLDTESGFRDAVLVTAAYGLGENVVQGAVNPDEFLVFKPTLASGHRPIVKRQLGSKAMRMIYTHDSLAGRSTRNIEVPPEERHRFCIDDDEVLELARQAVIIEEHYGRPMDIEWAKDGNTGELLILQARPETVQARADVSLFKQYILEGGGEAKHEIVASGRSVGQKIATGTARVILHARDMHQLKEGEVLVTDITDPDWEPIMKLASAIVTNRGGRTCHAAIIARELGIPAVVGCGDATQTVPSGEAVTVSCAEGDTGFIYRGELPFRVEEQRLDEAAAHTRTKVYVNVAQAEQAFEFSRLPADGVGLARLEFIIMRGIQAHPNALLQPEKVDEESRTQIARLTRGYQDGRDFFVRRLAEGVAQIAAAFYPRPVIVRFSDFKSNEYAALLGGAPFEPHEENPMIGLRGAARYHHPDYAEGFALECEAMKLVRETMGLDNVALLLPFVRSVGEAREVIELMARNGLKRGEAGLKLYIMCEIPSNAILADQFLDLCDGFSIGSNDLTQLTLGVDRDSGLLTGFDERDPAVLELIRMAISACRAQGKYIGICGQAPSDFPEITRFLVEQGIDSLSLNPDSLLRMRQVVGETERG